MTFLTTEIKGNNMWFIFQTKKEKQRLDDLQKKEDLIEANKKAIADKSEAATKAIDELNELVKKHGIGGLIYFSTGKGRK